MRNPAPRTCLLSLLLIAIFILPASVTAQEGVPAAVLKARLWAADGLATLPVSEDAGQRPRQIEAMRTLNTPGAETAGIALRPNQTRITFQSGRDGNWEVYLALGDGSGATRLTANGASDVRPDLNPNATRVAFSSMRSGTYDIYAMNADGSDVRALTQYGPSNISPSWSPDGNRIVFAHYRNEEWDLYVMNADGAGAMRLTYGEGSNLMPAWSPDGQQIAWVRKNGTVGRIMVMNADGSAVRAVTPSLRYVQNPAWSPDGMQLAFDYDADNDDWNELAMIRPDGGGLHTVYDPGGVLVDAWMGSWSPDGGQLLFTLLLYVVENDQLYINATGLVLIPAAGGTPVALPGSGIDMLPRWRVYDVLPPATSVTGLPPQSPGPISVAWSGADAGPAGIVSYDMQVRDGASGAWTDWLVGTTATSGAYPGVGGHTYAFRSRGADAVGNVEQWPAVYDALTTVESLPPISRVLPLPTYLRYGSFISWEGRDEGGSGIRAYDVQLRDLTVGGEWEDWIVQTTDTTTYLFQPSGHTYTARSRSVDGAGNVEAWPAEPGDTQTTLYRWAISGHVADNRDRPLANSIITTWPEALVIERQASSGVYRAIVGEPASPYQVTWTQRGFGSLPPTLFNEGADARLDVNLPPLDNVMQDWGFEDEGTAPVWVPGEMASQFSEDARHTGRLGARLGSETGASFSGPVVIPQGGSEVGFDLAAGDHNTAHLVWSGYVDYVQVLQYATRMSDGSLSAPRRLDAGSGGVNQPQLRVAQDGTVHVIWREWGWAGTVRVMYAHRTPAGAWSGPETISTADAQVAFGIFGLGMDLDAAGDLHVVWTDGAQFAPTLALAYRRRSREGTWSAIEPVMTSTQPPSYVRIAISGDGVAHVIWMSLLGWDSPYEVNYARRPAGGGWSAVQRIAPADARRPQIAADDRGVAHVVWEVPNPANVYAGDVYYARCGPDGACSAGQEVSQHTGRGGGAILAADRSGGAHVVWMDRPVEDESVSGVFYRYTGADGRWAPVVTIAGPSYRTGGALLAVDASGAAYVAWREDDLYYKRRSLDGAWSPAFYVASATHMYSTAMATDGQGRTHFFYHHVMGMVYVGPTLALQTTESNIAQTVHISHELNAPTLSFLYQFNQNWPGDGNWLQAGLSDGLTAATIFSTTTPTTDWVHRWFDLTPWTGKTVTLTLNVHQTAGSPTAWAFLDEVTVGSGAYPDLWTAAAGQVAEPGATVTLTLFYGNRGEALARGATLTATLPVSLTFVSANPPANMVDSVLTWDLGAVPAGSAPHPITLVATVSPGAAPGAVLTGSMALASATNELETANNAAALRVYVGGVHGYLPLIWVAGR